MWWRHLKSLCGGGVPSSHPSLGLHVFFLSLHWARDHTEKRKSLPRCRVRGPMGRLGDYGDGVLHNCWECEYPTRVYREMSLLGTVRESR